MGNGTVYAHFSAAMLGELLLIIIASNDFCSLDSTHSPLYHLSGIKNDEIINRVLRSEKHFCFILHGSINQLSIIRNYLALW
jgi:hypothetical protein